MIKEKQINWEDIIELGKIPDVDLSKKLGISPQAVFQARKKRKIKALNPTNKIKIDWDLVPLGTMIDQHIADLLGCSNACVCKNRKKRNIPAFGMLYRTLENEAAYYEESIIDLWLHKNKISHKFQFKAGKYRVDWLIPENNEIWEFLGMWDHKIYGKNYRDNFEIKEKYLIENGYRVRRIYKNEIINFKKDIDLNKIHGMSHFICRGCNRENLKHQAKGLCTMCVGRIHKNQELGPPKISFLKPTDTFICEVCGNTDRYKQVKNKCRLCYMKIYRKI